MDWWYIYILECADGTLYTGITNDLSGRMLKHNEGTGAKYTRGRGPVRLLWWYTVEGRSTASKEEAAIKKLTRRQKLNLIKYGSANAKPIVGHVTGATIPYANAAASRVVKVCANPACMKPWRTRRGRLAKPVDGQGTPTCLCTDLTTGMRLWKEVPIREALLG